MRRIVAAVLLVALFGQTSGAASASALNDKAQIRLDIGAAMAPIYGALVGSVFYAMVTGQYDRYQEEHAPRPAFKRLSRVAERPPDVRSTRLAHYHEGLGVALRLPRIHQPGRPGRTRAEAGMFGRHGRHRSVLQLSPLGKRAPDAGNRRGLRANLASAALSPLSPSTTGINRWWTYEEHGIPGVGKAYANINTGNLLVQVTDWDIPERGIDLSLRRTYNSMSKHDTNSDDGTTPGLFGNGWTSTFDAHISSPDGTTVSVWDIDGARYDFDCSNQTLPSNQSPCVNLTAGDHNELYLDPANNSCTWAWQKKNGTVYEFYQLGAVSGCTQYGGGGVPAGLYGALGAIYARNHNNSLTFGYAFTGGDGSSYSNLTTMTVTHSDGDALVLTFGSAPDNSGGATPTELTMATLYRNGSAVPYARTWYGYNQIGNLLEVDHPANNTGMATTLVSGTVLPETYVVYPSVDTPNNPPTYEFACGPRYYMGGGGTGGGSSADGSCLKFSFGGVNGGGANQLTEWHSIGIANFTPQSCASSTSACNNSYNNGDTTGTLLQPGQSSGWQIIDEANFIYGNSINSNNPNATPCLPAAGSSSTCMADTDGHVTVWDLDSSGRVTKTHAATGAQSGVTWLVTQQFWSADTSGPYANNIISVIDPRGNQTDYAYDANGNTLVVAQPPVATSNGTFRPTSLYAYDGRNNIVAYCDPTKMTGASWPTFSPGSPSPAPGTCSNNTPTSTGDGITVYKWNSPTYEPDGELTDTYTPMGYHVSIAYNPASEGAVSVDYGLPTQVLGAQYTQADGTTRTPTQNFTYDVYGNLTTYGAGNGTWYIQYDNKNEVVMREDPDQVSSYTCYYHDGSVEFTQTANQHSLDNGGLNTNTPNCNDTTTPNAVNYTYDGDGDAVTESHRHGGTYVGGSTPTLGNVGVTVKYYDGLDRLVEVVEPYDSSADMYTNPWMTRYFYDLTQSAGNGDANVPTLTFSSATYSAYGNLFKTEELLPSGGGQYTSTIITPASVANNTWTEVKGQGFDALDRMTNRYSIVGGNLNDDSLTYDTNGAGENLGGLLAKQCNRVGQCQRFDYDARNMLSSFVTSDNSAPQRTYTYDPDGRTTAITSAAFTTAQTYTYDLDGNALISTEPKGASGQSAGGSTITHNYYPDGKLESVDVGGSVLVQAGLFTYDYRQDGRTKTEVINDGNVATATSNGKTTVSYTYSNAGRLNTRSEAGVGANTGATTNLTWTALGTLQADALPQTTLNKYEYSAENEVLGVSSSMPSAGGNPATWTYDVRGEVTSSPPTPIIGGTTTAYATSETLYANGTPIELSLGSKGGTPSNTTTNAWSIGWDDKMGVVKSMQYNTNNPNATPTQRLISKTSSSWSYDGAGRLTSETSTTTPASGTPTTWTLSRSFDAENHETDNGTIVWGPNGHPALISTGTKFQTLHWDGGQLLFTTELRSGVGTLVDIKVGSDGDITPLDGTFQGLTFYDRGPGGLVLGCHNKTGTTYVGLTDARAGEFTADNPVCTTAVTPSTAKVTPKFPTIQWSTSPSSQASGTLTSAIAPGTILGMPRPDGYAWGLGTLQGTRTFDSSAGTWTTPDAYSGEIHDPASQKSYMWNGNNAVGYSDPSGYDPTVSVNGSVITVTYQVVLELDAGLDIKGPEVTTFISNMNYSKADGGWTINVSTSIAQPNTPANQTTTVDLENSGLPIYNSLADGGAPANGGTDLQTRGLNWNVRIGTQYQYGPDQVRQGDRHEMGHNAGLNHEGFGDIMGPYMIHGGGDAGFSPGDVFDLLYSGNGSPYNEGGPGGYIAPDDGTISVPA